MKNYVLVGIFVLFAAWVLGQAVENRTAVKVHAIQIIDDAGTTRAVLSTDGNGEPFLRFYDEVGKVEWEASAKVKAMPLKH